MRLQGVRTAAAGVLRGLAELVSFGVAATSAVAQFLMGRWPDPVMLGKRGRGEIAEPQGRRRWRA